MKINIEEPFYLKLAERLLAPLPAERAFRTMSPAGRLDYTPNEKTRKSAVLILFYKHQADFFVPLILRPKYDGVHGGQMAFPGGKVEKTDKNLVATALREAQEEIGIKIQDVQILGKLTEIYIPPSNFLVQPIIGCLLYKPDFYPDVNEVDQIFEVAVSELQNTENIREEILDIQGIATLVKYYLLQNQKVWGATAMIISELLMVMKEANKMIL